MKSVRVFSSIAIGAALAAACGGISTVGNKLTEDDGGPPDSESGVEPRSDASAAPPDAGTPGMPGFNVSCQSAQSCPRSQVCCAALSLSGIDVACADSCAQGSYQVCLTNAECTTSGEVCTASPLGTGGFCTAARDAGSRGPSDSGAVEDGNAPDSGEVADGNTHDSGDIEDGSAHDAEIVVDASVAVEAASGNDAAGEGGGSDAQGMSDDGAADDDSSDIDGGAS